jgi:VanZ family protein
VNIIFLKKLFRWTVTLAYAGFIFYLSSRPWSSVPAFPFADKVYHLILYFGFGGFLLWALRLTRLRYHGKLIFIAFAIAVLYGLSDEVHQVFVPGREFSFIDLAADAAGAAAGLFAASKIAAALKKEKGYEKL